MADGPNKQGMAGGPPYGVRTYDPVQGNNALYNAIRAHEATIRGTGVTNVGPLNRRAHKERMPTGTNATSPGVTTGGL
jgi:hypothetical protein